MHFQAAIAAKCSLYFRHQTRRRSISRMRTLQRSIAMMTDLLIPVCSWLDPAWYVRATESFAIIIGTDWRARSSIDTAEPRTRIVWNARWPLLERRAPAR